MNEIIIILSRWFHLLGTVIWIGAMILLDSAMDLDEEK